MTSHPERSEGVSPPYKWAIVTSLVVLLGYLVSLAPSVTFWDAGEFIAAMNRGAEIRKAMAEEPERYKSPFKKVAWWRRYMNAVKVKLDR